MINLTLPQMDYTTAKKQVIAKRVIGVFILLISSLFMLAGLLTFLYSSLDSGGPALSQLSFLIKKLVYASYQRTQFLWPIWNNASAPNMNDLTSSGTLGFIAWYIAMFLGASIFRSGNRLAKRLRLIDRQIEDKEIRVSVKGQQHRTRKEIQDGINIPKQSVWKEIHTLYIAPLVVGVILYVVGKLFS